jgi:hypothetical protein
VQIFYKCDFYVDQGRKIGDDPVGYKCSNDAVMELEIGALICKNCLQIESTRLTLGKVYGYYTQYKTITDWLYINGIDLENK